MLLDHYIHGDTKPALIRLLVTSMLNIIVFLSLLTPAFESKKMSPILRLLDAELAEHAPVHILAKGSDETLLGIVPFITGRELVLVKSDLLNSPAAPAFILIQTKERKAIPINPGANYILYKKQITGSGRLFSLWKRTSLKN